MADPPGAIGPDDHPDIDICPGVPRLDAGAALGLSGPAQCRTSPRHPGGVAGLSTPDRGLYLAVATRPGAWDWLRAYAQAKVTEADGVEEVVLAGVETGTAVRGRLEGARITTYALLSDPDPGPDELSALERVVAGEERWVTSRG